ncbi:MAG: hypothetical protein JO253_03210 [Alphaproteobacteria bacterium]|nr:hypothetical protein [Alphaproteobacteria bacterium]
MAIARGRIKPGTICGIDFRNFRWPNIPPEYQPPNFAPDMLFNIESHGAIVECWCDGFGGGVDGRTGRYFNGSIYVYKG